MTCLHRYSLDSTFILLVICGSIGLSAQQSGVPQVKQSSQPRIVKPVGEEEVTLFCNVKEAVSYTWYKNGKVIPAAFDRYTVKKYRYLRIVDVVKSDSGLFVCVASNGYGSANCTISFLVEDPTVKPTNITGEKPQFRRLDLMRKTEKEFRVGEKSVILMCEAVGKPTPIVTWYKDGKIYEKSGQRPGPYDYQLELNELDVAHSGSYMCNVSNAFGFLTYTYNITVEDVIRSQPNILVIWEQKSPRYVGQNVEISCTIVTFDPNTKYYWYYSDTAIIRDEDKLGVLIDPRLYEQPKYNGGNQEMAHVIFTLTLQNLTINQSGLYGCRAENIIGTESRQTNLTVTHRPFTISTDIINDKPTILVIWEQKSPLYVGQNVEISCTIVTFDPNTKYHWYYSDTNIPNDENLGVLIDPRLYEQPAYNGGNQEMAHVKFTLMLQNLTINQSGLYGCRAENKIGPESRQTNLTVTHRSIVIPPVFADTSAGALTELPTGHSVMLKCKADGAAPLKYTWLKDGKILRGRTLDPYLNTSIWYLKLKDLVPGDAGLYTCIVSNPYGSINHTYSVRVQDNPLDAKDTGSESDDPVIMDKVSWILLGVSIAVFVAMVTASAWLCMKMRKLKMSSRTNARGARHNIESLRARYDVQNEYVVVPDFN